MIKFWNFVKNQMDNNAVDLLLYGEICSDEPWYTDDYVAYRQFIRDLHEVTEDVIHLRINSPGGEVMAANAIFNQLKDSGKKIIAHIDGMCASAATIPLMAAEKIIASCNAMILIHDPLLGLCGYYNSKDLNEMLEYCDKIKESIIATYRSRITSVSEEEFSTLMTEERWLNANEAQDIGLVDEVAYSDIANITDRGKYITINSVKIKKGHFKNMPVNCRAGMEIDTHQKNDKKGGSEQMDETEVSGKIKTAEDLQKAYPELCEDLKKEAVQEERTRLKELDEICAVVPEELLLKAKYEEPVAAKDLAFQALLAERKMGTDFTEKMKNDLHSSNAERISPAPQDLSGEEEEETGGTPDDKKVGKLVNAIKEAKNRRKTE